MEPDRKKSRFGIRLKIKELLNTINLIGLTLGGIGGVIYFLNANTINGTFPITSSLPLTIIWGALIGFLLADILYQSIKKRKK
jgi:Mg/Co/Ni transporter MgtE